MIAPAPALLLVGPVLLLLVALIPATVVSRVPRLMGRLVQGAALAGLLATLMAAIGTYLAPSTASMTVVLLGTDSGPVPLSLSILADGLTFTIMGLVSLVAVIIARYSTNYLAGEPEQGRFFRRLGLTVSAFMLVVVAGNLLMFSIAIIVTSTALNGLLTHYANRQPAQMVAHKKLLFSRMADVCLLSAAVLIGASVGSLSFEAIAAAVGTPDLAWQLHLSAWLIVAYAVLKSGQFPFHGWLLQVMEAPTPVSALLHAGIVYSGAIIVLRTHELLLADGSALFALALVGLATATLASVAMLTQTAIKSSLAWSTAGQLGFMLLELGLGLFVIAVLHLVTHSLYKAHAFLSSGSMVDILRAPAAAAKTPVTPLRWAVATGFSAALSFGVAALWGITLTDEPALVAIGAIVAVAVAQLLFAGAAGAALLLRLSLVSVLVTTVYFGLHSGFAAVYSDVLSPIPSMVSTAYYVLIALTATVFVALSYFQVVLISRSSSAWLQRLYVHLYNGLYTDLPVERLVYRVWPARFRDLPGRRGPLRS